MQSLSNTSSYAPLQATSQASSYAPSHAEQPLHFRSDGSFRVLQMADIQDGPDVSPDTIRLLEAAIAQADPDLVVLTGDQIRGYDPAWMRTFLRRRGEKIGDRVRVVTKFESAFREKNECLHQAVHNRIAQLLRLVHAKPETVSRLDTMHQQLDDVEQRMLDASEQHRDTTKEQLLDDARAKVRQCFQGFLAPMVAADVPFAATYGNHDFQCGILIGEQDDIYREFAGCLNPKASDENALAPEPGTFALPIYTQDGTRIAMSIMMVNSGDYADDMQQDADDTTSSNSDNDMAHARAGSTSASEQAAYMVNARGLDLADSDGYGLPSEQALDWLESVQHTLQQMNGDNKPVPSIAFQHIAPQEFYDCLKEVPAYTPHAVEGARAFAGRCFVLNPDVCYPGGMLGESIGCADTNAGQVERMRQAGGYFALYCGHDHKNAFVGHVHDMDLGYAPTCGFTSYGPKTKLRGVRLFEFHESDPTKYRTRMLNWGELVGGRSSNELRVFVEDHVVTDGASLRDELRRPSVFATLSALSASVLAAVSYGVFRISRALYRAVHR